MATPRARTQTVPMKSTRIIIFAQVLSVTASVTGLVGLIIAYRALNRDSASNDSATTRVPTIS